VRLLFDQNLAPRLARSLADLYPDSAHVRDVGLANADDVAVWEYAKQNALAIVSKDADFHQRSFL
jgi:predicted nuclease of predicted toxin-antitoxin system